MKYYLAFEIYPTTLEILHLPIYTQIPLSQHKKSPNFNPHNLRNLTLIN